MITLITGASSGIGYQVAKLLAKRSNVVYGGARHLAKMTSLKRFGIHPVKLDVTDSESCRNCVKRITQNEGRIDVLINCAGYGSFGPVEEVPMKEAEMQINVNVLGIARLSKLVLPSMRKNHFGKIINISSIAGRIPVYFGGWYNVSKYAVEALSSDMRIELAPFGISVSIIEPGIIKTPWGKIAAKHLTATANHTPYVNSGNRVAKVLEHQYRPTGNATPPIKVAKAIQTAVLSKQPKSRYAVGRYARLLLLLHAIMPTRIFDQISRNL